MKDSTADYERHEAYLAAVSGLGFALCTGTEPLLVRSVHAGAAGSINGPASCRPELFTALWVGLAEGDEDAVGRLHEEVDALKFEVAAEGSAVAAFK